MQAKHGTTGLTQKEAIFRIFKQILGTSFRENEDVSARLRTEANSYGRARRGSPLFNQIVQEIYNGLRSGVVPSKLNSSSEKDKVFQLDKLQREYSSRIAHYWMSHDKRLNGGKVGSRVAKFKRQHLTMESRSETDPSLKSMRHLLKDLTNPADRLEVEKYISIRLLEIIIETLEIDIAVIPKAIQRQLGIDKQIKKENQEAA